MALVVRIKPRAQREIHRAAEWWQANRPAAPGAIAAEVRAAVGILVERPRIGVRLLNSRDPETRRFYLARTGYFIYYRTGGQSLMLLRSGMRREVVSPTSDSVE